MRVPNPPRSLDAAAAQQLTAHVEASLRRQRRELAASLERGLGIIPFPLRVAVRRVLGL